MPYKSALKRETLRITLPTDNTFWVEIYTRCNWAERKALRAAALSKDASVDLFSIGMDTAMKILICAWNLTDENDQTLPLTQENIDKLDVEDLEAIAEALTPVVNPPATPKEAEQKKTSGLQSTNPLKAESPAPLNS